MFLIHGELLSVDMRVWLVPGDNCTAISLLSFVEAAVEEVSADRTTLFVYANGSQLSDASHYSTCVAFQAGVPLVLVNDTGLVPGWQFFIAFLFTATFSFSHSLVVQLRLFLRLSMCLQTGKTRVWISWADKWIRLGFLFGCSPPM